MRPWCGIAVTSYALLSLSCTLEGDPRCVKKTGNNAHPEDCSKFLSCSNGTMIAEQSCSDGTLYWPKNQSCEFAEDVAMDCGQRKIPVSVLICKYFVYYLTLINIYLPCCHGIQFVPSQLFEELYQDLTIWQKIITPKMMQLSSLSINVGGHRSASHTVVSLGSSLCSYLDYATQTNYLLVFP